MTNEHRHFFEAFIAGRNIFVTGGCFFSGSLRHLAKFTGGPGTGKSRLIRHLVKNYPTFGPYGITATGRASVRVNGVTIHWTR